MEISRIIMAVGVASLLVEGCGQTQKEEKVMFTTEGFDTTVSLGDDFYQYSNGGWMKNHPIPGDKSRMNTFDVLNDENLERLREIVESASAKSASNSLNEGTNEQKIGDYYALAMDSVRREREGLSPILSLLSDIKATDFSAMGDSAVAAKVAEMHLSLGNPFFAVGCTPDAKNSKMNIGELWQDGLGLPDRDYYFDETEKGREIIEGYKRMLSGFFGKVDGVDTVRRAEAVYEFEKSMAEMMNTKVENRDPQKTYNKISYNELKEHYPMFNWDAYFSKFPVCPEEITLGQLKYFGNIFTLIKNTDRGTLSDYVLMQTVNYLASYLSDEYAMIKFDFYGKQLGGVTERKPLWKRSLEMVQGRLGMPLGELFVEKHFTEKAKSRTINLVEGLRTAFSDRINKLQWMSDSTKKLAQTKLEAMKLKVGYPDKWEDYGEAKVDKQKSLVENYMALTRFASEKSMREIGKPVDENKWYMTPQTVNAYYSPLNNEIVFPAGILQPPFFYADGDDAVNYGAIGVVIGHEMTHGFDDSGRQFDKDGNLQDWWTADDSDRFKEATSKLTERFSKVVVIDSMRCNGELTLGENIADLGGLNIAHQAYRNNVTKGTEEMIEGMDGDQRFLYAYSRIWAGNYRDEYLRQQVKTDPHSNGKYRVNTQLPMLGFFYEAFDIKESDAMYEKEEDRIKIW